MYETEPQKAPRSRVPVLLGFLLGVVAGLATLIVSIFFTFTFQVHEKWLLPALNAAVLIGIGIVASRHARESSYALGMVIALSIALLLDAAYAVAFLR